MSFLEHKIPPPLIGLACAALAWRLADGVWPQLAWSLHLLSALALVACGLALELWAWWELRDYATTVNPLTPERTSSVVQTGPYRYTRNPMYLGMALQLLAWCVWLGAPKALLALPCFVAWITRFQILPEERVLAQRFGAAYGKYHAWVRRWI